MRLSALMLPILIVAGAGPAAGGVGEIYADASLAYPGPEQPVLYCNPDGSGNPFTAARILGGATVDATVSLELRDLSWVPIVGYPAEDMWLESQGGGLAPCPGGSVADAPTDAAGLTTWTAPLRAGGWDAGPTLVLVSGAPINDVPLGLAFNSADLTGDGRVDLADARHFAEDYFGQYRLRSDLFYDGSINISDLGKLAQAVGNGCD